MHFDENATVCGAIEKNYVLSDLSTRVFDPNNSWSNDYNYISLDEASNEIIFDLSNVDSRAVIVEASYEYVLAVSITIEIKYTLYPFIKIEHTFIVKEYDCRPQT